MKLTTILLAGAIVVVGAGYARAQDAQADKTIIANERAINNAIDKGNVAGFTALVAADGWSVDGTAGRMSVADFLKGFDQMTRGMKISSEEMTESMVQWVDATTAVHSYKWLVQGTYQGSPCRAPSGCRPCGRRRTASGWRCSTRSPWSRPRRRSSVTAARVPDST